MGAVFLGQIGLLTAQVAMIEDQRSTTDRQWHGSSSRPMSAARPAQPVNSR